MTKKIDERYIYIELEIIEKCLLYEYLSCSELEKRFINLNLDRIKNLQELLIDSIKKGWGSDPRDWPKEESESFVTNYKKTYGFIFGHFYKKASFCEY